MKINYDRVADAIYLHVSNGKIKKTVEINDSITVDVGEKDKVIGIEILDFSYQQDKKQNINELTKNGIPLHITEAIPAVA